MDFTREPIIESVITPKEGYKIVVRSSKNSGQEEFFIDAVEVVSFGNCFFFRSLERPKEFLVPVSDYEILEVREARMMLKNVALDKSVKIGGGKEPKIAREPAPEKKKEEEAVVLPEGEVSDKKKDRRRNYRRRRGKDEPTSIEEPALPQPLDMGEEKEMALPLTRVPPSLTSLLPPPPMLISETLARYRDDELFKEVFVEREELEPAVEEILEQESIHDAAIEEPPQADFQYIPEEPLHETPEEGKDV